MKKILFIVVLAVFTTTVFGQSFDRQLSTRIQIGPAIGFSTHNPLKDVPGNNGWGLGIGGFLQAERFFQENVSGVLQVGVVTYAGKSNGPNTKNKAYNTIPIRGGLNAYYGDLHVGAQIGVGLNSAKIHSEGSKSQTAFAYSPQIGYNFFRKDVPLDLSLSWEGYLGKGNFSGALLRLSWIL